MVTPALALLGSNGDQIELSKFSDGYVPLQGGRGYGIPPTMLTLLEGAGDGAIHRFTRRGPRDIDLPVAIFGANRTEVLERQRRLAAALRFTDPETPARLQFTLESGEVFEIPVHYAAGAETTIGSSGASTYTRWLLTLRCPDPFWAAVVEQTIVFRLNAIRRGLLPRLVKMQVGSSQVLGSRTVNNRGDVDTPMVWKVTGPGGPFTATSSRGEEFSFTTVLTAGESITIDTKAGTVVDASGTNRYAELAPAPKLWSLPPGESLISVLLANATSASSIVGLYRPRRELVY